MSSKSLNVDKIRRKHFTHQPIEYVSLRTSYPFSKMYQLKQLLGNQADAVIQLNFQEPSGMCISFVIHCIYSLVCKGICFIPSQTNVRLRFCDSNNQGSGILTGMRRLPFTILVDASVSHMESMS